MGEHLLIYQLFGEHHLARWCSRLARQPVTLEVDGSSPFRVAKALLFGEGLFVFVSLVKLQFIYQSPLTMSSRAE